MSFDFDLCACYYFLKKHFYVLIFFFLQFLIVQAGKAARLEKFEIPAKIKLLWEAWTPESGLVTAALKIKRESIRKAFSEDLAKLYS